MSAIAWLVLLALLGAVCSGGLVKRESPPIPVYSPCLVKGSLVQHGERPSDPCDRCGCLDGELFCDDSICIIDGRQVPLPSEGLGYTDEDGSGI